MAEIVEHHSGPCATAGAAPGRQVAQNHPIRVHIRDQ
jgi:hypothetical protein